MRRHRVFLLCTVGLCVISFLHYYKALHYVSLLRELSAPYPNIKSFIMVTGFFWKEAPHPISSAHPNDFDYRDHGPRIKGHQPGVELDVEKVIRTSQVRWKVDEPKQSKADAIEDLQVKQKWPNLTKEEQNVMYPGSSNETRPGAFGEKVPKNRSTAPYPDSAGPLGDHHLRHFQLRDDPNSYFVHTKAGALCFRQGTELAAPRDALASRRILEIQEVAAPSQVKLRRGKRQVNCVCRPGWHGPHCGVPTMVQHSTLPTKERLIPREVPRRVINAINVNHEFDLLHVRFHELAQAVDLFIVCESNFTAYGDVRPLHFLHHLRNGTYDYIRHKILYVFLDHFPEGGRQDGWIADDYLRTFLTRNGISRVKNLRRDDVFIINDADEIPAQEGLLFLKLFEGWTEPFAIHMRKSLYGFFWKQLGSLEVVSGCTVGMLTAVYDRDGIKLRRRDYYTMPGFRKYENETGHILVQWSIGSPFHFAGWHCSWCFTPEGIRLKLISAQNGDFPRWGDYEDKLNLNYIRDLIRTGGWFDGSVLEYPPTDPNEHMYAPKFMLNNYVRYHYLLENPYAKESRVAEG